MPTVLLSERAVVRIDGPEAEKLLQDVITPDLNTLGPEDALGGALLTPQGKIMFDFVIARDGDDGFLLDLDSGHSKDFVKRMMLYRLRAKVQIATDPAVSVFAAWERERLPGAKADRRFPGSTGVMRLYSSEAPAQMDGGSEDYVRLRIQGGVAESGHDFAPGDAFPHDILMDLNGGVSFKKGCFVGQEVVSRMQHRGTARRRLVHVEAESPIESGEITAGGKTIGTIGSVVGTSGLAIVRTDRAAAVIETGTTPEANGVPVTLALPGWSGLRFPAMAEEQ